MVRTDEPAEPPAQDAGRTEPGPDDAERVRARFEQLVQAGVAISSEHALDAVLQRIADSAREVVGARYAALGVLDGDGATLVRFVTSGISDQVRRRIGELPRGHGVLGQVIREARPIRVPDLSRHPQSYGFPAHHPTMRSFLGVPIRMRERVFGNLYLTDKAGGEPFDAEDEAIVVLLASQAAVAVESARLYEEQAQLLGKLQTMQRQRDQFFAMINHELRNALTAVFGWSERLVKGKTTSEASQRAAREVFEAAERTITLLNNLLDLSRLDADRIQAVWRDVDLGELARRAVAAVQPVADAKPVRLLIEAPNPPPSCRTDPLRVEQILINLLNNAVRHSTPGEDVVVRLESLPDEVRLHVMDRGPGIAHDLQAKIFEPFVRVDPESGLGSGLGLPVCRRLAELLGGRLTVYSALGRGATFTLTLPSEPAASQAHTS
jgi:signal transduction histidine kinase